MAAIWIIAAILLAAYLLAGFICVVAVEGGRPKFRWDDVFILVGWAPALVIAWWRGRWASRRDPR